MGQFVRAKIPNGHFDYDNALFDLLQTCVVVKICLLN